MIYLDIETESLPESDLLASMPAFEAPSNYKDPEKIAANITDQKARWLESAALSPMTGRVLAVGFIHDGEFSIYQSDEYAALACLASVLTNERNFTATEPRICGWNVRGFDIPFLIRRGWLHGIHFPRWLTDKAPFGQEPPVLDLMEVWKAGDYRAPHTGLDTAAKFLGLPGKLGKGADFARLYREDRNAAIEYLRRDVELLPQIKQRIYA